MSAAAVMAIVLFLFFLLGVAVGVLVVIALSARRAHKPVRRIRPVTPPPRKWPYRPEPDPDDRGPEEPPWWHARSGE
jgi:MFS superfamily sulfate permease-like transporter